MKESDYPEEEYFYLPVSKKTVAKYLFLNPQSDDVRDFIRDVDIIMNRVLDFSYAEQKKTSGQSQPGQPKIDKATGEQQYLKCQLDDETKQFYR